MFLALARKSHARGRMKVPMARITASEAHSQAIDT